MKCVIASTIEQEKILGESIDYIYTTIFPRYFSDQQIKEFLDIGILKIDREELARLHTLKTSFQAMACLQVLITILEMLLNGDKKKEQEKIFDKNIRILNECELLFPFTYQNFLDASRKKTTMQLSEFVNPTNSLLI